MSPKTISVDSAGEAYLTLLADRGVDFLFGNGGSDFASIIEALSKSAAGRAQAPMPITVPHENLAVAMAHGAYLATGQVQAVMLHVNVGTANAICALLNAQRENIPVLLTAGRTPIFEGDVPGARSVFIHWGQEMYDQAGMLREVVKWDYELRSTGQVEDVVDRALSIAMSEPRGPVYLTLPREVLMEGAGDFTYDSPSIRLPASPPAPDIDAVEQLAGWIAAAERPMIVTASFGRDPAAVPDLVELAERFALPVIGYRSRYTFMPTSSPMHLGYEPNTLLEDADLIVTLDCDVPWIPDLYKVPDQARVAHLGVDPLFSNYPMRSFRSDLAITGDSGATLRALTRALDIKSPPQKVMNERRERLAGVREAWLKSRTKAATPPPEGTASTAAWVAACLNKAKRDDDMILNETFFPIGLLDLEQPCTSFTLSPAGGLGWSLGAALGLKLGLPNRRAISVIGDGSYMFGNPTPAHFVSNAFSLPTLTIILNNRMWASVRKATLAQYPDGEAARANQSPLTYLDPAPEYHKIVEASGGYGEKVERAEDFPAALERAFKAVDEEKRQAVLNVLTDYTDADAKRDAKK